MFCQGCCLFQQSFLNSPLGSASTWGHTLIFVGHRPRSFPRIKRYRSNCSTRVLKFPDFVGSWSHFMIKSLYSLLHSPFHHSLYSPYCIKNTKGIFTGKNYRNINGSELLSLVVACSDGLIRSK